MPTDVMEERKSLTLYAAEEYLAELLETEGAVAEEQQEAFDLELSRSLAAAQDKREAVARFILQCEAEAEFAKSESDRIRARGKVFERAADRVREYVLGYILAQGVDHKGKFPKLAGKTTIMSARSNPPSVEIIDAEEVPARFKTVKVEMRLEQWYQLVEAHPDETAGALQSIDIDKRMLKEAMGHGEDIPGADLNIGIYHLAIK